MTRAVKIGKRTLQVDDDQPTFWRRVEAGEWEPDTLAFLDAEIDARTTFLDLGAWVGPTALYAAFAAERVVAVEADPAALDQLARNLATNPPLSGKIEVIPRAVHPSPGRVRLGARRKPGDSMSSVLLASSGPTFEADAITPAELLPLTTTSARLVVKIDLEGAEYALLPHLKALLDRAEAVHLSLHPELLLEGGEDRDAAIRISRHALASLSSFDFRCEEPLPGGDLRLTRRSRAPASH
jgi:FkbM family methyltransferase